MVFQPAAWIISCLPTHLGMASGPTYRVCVASYVTDNCVSYSPNGKTFVCSSPIKINTVFVGLV